MSSCGCDNNIENNCIKKCQPVSCTCAVRLNSDCITVSGAITDCSGIDDNLLLTDFLSQLDAFICTKFEDLAGFTTLKNIGTGSDVYKGIDGIGRKEIRRINALGDLITVTQNTNDISISIDEDVLNDFIESNQNTYSIDNVGTGAEVFKDTTVVGDNTQFNLRTLIYDAQGGIGESVIRDIQQNSDDITIRGKKINSSSLTITATDEEISIETPITASIPALYVNNLYEPTYEEWLTENGIQNAGTPIAGFIFRGKGTIAQPFTDSIEYPLLGGSPTITTNTSVQNSLNGDAAYVVPYSYVGAGTRLAPDRLGEKIIIQNNNGSYTFANHLNYTGLDIEIQGDFLSTTSGFLIDMEDATGFNQSQSIAKITLSEGVLFQIQGDGFNNEGSTTATNNLVDVKTISLLGEGGEIYSDTNDITKYIVNSDTSDTGNNNDGGLTFNIECKIRTIYQGIYLVGGVSRVDSYNAIQSGILGISVNASLKAFHQTGGQVRMFKNSSVIFEGGTRVDAITFTPAPTYTPSFIGIGVSFAGTADSLFTKTSTDSATLDVSSSSSGYGLNLTEVFDSPDLWEVSFRNNVFGSGNIDATKADLTLGNTISSINTMGGNIIESLLSFTSKETARATLPMYAAYLLLRPVDADDLVLGTEYKITTVGSPSLGTLGAYFVATGAETGTGVGTLVERCIAI